MTSLFILFFFLPCSYRSRGISVIPTAMLCIEQRRDRRHPVPLVPGNSGRGVKIYTYHLVWSQEYGGLYLHSHTPSWRAKGPYLSFLFIRLFTPTLIGLPCSGGKFVSSFTVITFSSNNSHDTYLTDAHQISALSHSRGPSLKHSTKPN